MSDALASIIAAVIGVLGTLLVTKWDDLISIFRSKPRDISGTWEGDSYEISYGPNITNEPPRIDHEPTMLNKYIVNVTQRGNKFTAIMNETETFTPGAEKVMYKWKGEIVNDYIIYESICLDSETSMRSTAMLFVEGRGRKMKGYFVATSSGLKAPLRTWVGYAILTKKGK